MSKRTSIKPGKVWLDTNGNRIQAHAGYMIFVDDTFYWYGENKENVTSEYEVWHYGVRLYSSKDLYNWTDEGVICLPDLENEESPLHPKSKMDRPHILYNDKTKQFVLWMKVMEDGGANQYMVIATSETIKGPFCIVNERLQPLGMKSGDFDLVKDDDGKAYIVFERVHSDMIVADLTDDYLDVTGKYSVHFPRKCPPYVREAPAVFKRDEINFVYTSGTSAKFPNPSEVARFSDFHGEWEELGDPHVGDEKKTSFDSQISCVFKYPYAEDLYIAMADRWLVDMPEGLPSGHDVYAALFDPDADQTYKDFDLFKYTKKNTSIADYVWLPIKWEDGVPKLYWLDEWKIEDFI